MKKLLLLIIALTTILFNVHAQNTSGQFKTLKVTESANFNNKPVNSVGDPVADMDAVNKRSIKNLETQTVLNKPILNENILTISYIGENGTLQTQTVDLSSLVLQDKYITSVSFEPTTKLLTVSRNDNQTFTATLIHTHTKADITDLQLHWNEITNKPTFATVATSGSYNDLINKPAIQEPLQSGFLYYNSTTKTFEPHTSLVPNKTVIRINNGTMPQGYGSLVIDASLMFNSLVSFGDAHIFGAGKFGTNNDFITFSTGTNNSEILRTTLNSTVKDLGKITIRNTSNVNPLSFTFDFGAAKVTSTFDSINSKGKIYASGFDAKNNVITNVANPVNQNDAANKKYIDDLQIGTRNYFLASRKNLAQLIDPIWWNNWLSESIAAGKKVSVSVRAKCSVAGLTLSQYFNGENGYMAFSEPLDTDWKVLTLTRTITGAGLTPDNTTFHLSRVVGNTLYIDWICVVEGDKPAMSWIAAPEDIRLSIPKLESAPASATASGIAGQIIITTDYIYYCVAENTWKRTPLTTW